MDKESLLLKSLIEFKFGELDQAKLKHSLGESLNTVKINEYLNSGWREKLIVAFYSAFFKDKDCLKQLERNLFEEVNGRQIKGYILALIVNLDRNESLKLLDEYLFRFSDTSRELDWIMAARNIVLGTNIEVDNSKAHRFKDTYELVY